MSKKGRQTMKGKKNVNIAARGQSRRTDEGATSILENGVNAEAQGTGV